MSEQWFSNDFINYNRFYPEKNSGITFFHLTIFSKLYLKILWSSMERIAWRRLRPWQRVWSFVAKRLWKDYEGKTQSEREGSSEVKGDGREAKMKKRKISNEQFKRFKTGLWRWWFRRSGEGKYVEAIASPTYLNLQLLNQMKKNSHLS